MNIRIWEYLGEYRCHDSQRAVNQLRQSHYEWAEGTPSVRAIEGVEQRPSEENNGNDGGEPGYRPEDATYNRSGNQQRMVRQRTLKPRFPVAFTDHRFDVGNGAAEIQGHDRESAPHVVGRHRVRAQQDRNREHQTGSDDGAEARQQRPVIAPVSLPQGQTRQHRQGDPPIEEARHDDDQRYRASCSQDSVCESRRQVAAPTVRMRLQGQSERIKEQVRKPPTGRQHQLQPTGAAEDHPDQDWHKGYQPGAVLVREPAGTNRST